MENKCTITGASGFIGTNLKTYFKDRNIIFNTLSRNILHKVSANDLRDSNTVIHLAGIAHVMKKDLSADDYYAVNYDLTKILFDAFLESKVQKFIFLSSVKAAADEVDELLTETHRPKPKTAYGLSKLLAEQYLMSRTLPEGKSVYILRPSMTHGEGNKGNLNLLFRLVQTGLPYPLAKFENKRSFLSVRNLCFVINEIVTRNDIPTDIYHICDDEAISTNEVVSVLAAAMNKKARLWNVSPKLITFAAKIGDLMHLPLNSDRLNKLTQNYVVSNEKIKKVIAKPFPLSALAGLQLTAESFSQKTAYSITKGTSAHPVTKTSFQ
jgi:nucleoside-diphosphate-sugar epimerase